MPLANILRIPESGFSYLGKSYVRYRDARSLTLGSRGYFFLIDTDVCRVNEAPREKKKSVSGALSNRKHGLFHFGYFKNGLLEPG